MTKQQKQNVGESSSHKMNLLLISQYFIGGGLETRISDQVSVLKKLGIDTILATSSPKGAGDGIGFKAVFSDLNFADTASFQDIYQSIKTLSSVIDKYKITHIDSHPFYSQLVGALLAQKHGLPSNITLHGPASVDMVHDPLYRLLYQHGVIQSANTIFCVSPETQILAENRWGQKAELLNNTVDVSDERSPINMPATKSKKIMWAGRIDSEKLIGLKHFLNLCQNHKIQIDIYGDGPAHNDLLEFIDDQAIPKNKVTLKGWHNDLRDVMKNYAAVAGMGRVLLEASSLNLQSILVGYDDVKGLLTGQNIDEAAHWNFSGRGMRTCTQKEFDGQLKQIINGNNQGGLFDWIVQNRNRQDGWKHYVDLIKDQSPIPSPFLNNVYEYVKLNRTNTAIVWSDEAFGDFCARASNSLNDSGQEKQAALTSWQLSKLEKQVTAINSDYQALQSKTDQIPSVIFPMLQSHLSKSTQPIEQALQLIENLNEQQNATLASTQNQLIAEQEAIKTISSTVSSVEYQVQNLLTGENKRAEAVNTLVTEFENLRTTSDKQDTVLKDLNDRITQQNIDNQAADQTRNDLLSAMQKTLHSLTQSNQILATKQEETIRLNSNQHQKLHQADQSRDILLSNMQETLHELTQSNQALAAKQEETIRLNSVQQQKLHEAELSAIKLTAIQRTLSWRITYPLRLTGGILKFIFGFGSRPQNKLAFLKQKRQEVGIFRTIIWVLNWLATRHLPAALPQSSAATPSNIATEPIIAAEPESETPQSEFKKLIRSKEAFNHVKRQDHEPILTASAFNQTHAPSIIMFADNFTSGGVERVMLDLSIQMNTANVSVLIVITNKASDVIKELDQYNIPYFSLEGDGERLRKIIQSYNVKLVYAHYGFGMMDVFSATGTPVIEVLHNAYHWQREDQSMIDFRSTHMHSFIAVSEFVADYNQTYLSIPPEKTTVIHNGMNTHGFIRPPIEMLRKKRLETISSRPHLLFVANLHAQKNHRLIVNSLKKVHEKFPTAILTIAGEFNRDSELGTLVMEDIEKLRLADIIHFTGLLDRTELSRLMYEAHVAILPTLFEGFSIAGLEYSYFGLPSILSRTGAADHMQATYGHVKVVPEAALEVEKLSIEAVEQHSKFGFEAAITPLADEIIDVLQNYEPWLEKACDAALAHNEYSIQSTAKAYLEIYKTIIPESEAVR